MRTPHIATIVVAAVMATALIPAAARAGQHKVRSIADSIRMQSGGRVTITCGDGVEALAEIDSTAVETPSVRHESTSGNETSETTTTTTHRRVVHKSGYRIQVYSDNNQRQAKSKAQQIASSIKRQFPHYGLYLTYNAPYWRLRVGDFTTQEAARSAMSALKSKFPSLAGDMRVVRDKVKVYE